MCILIIWYIQGHEFQVDHGTSWHPSYSLIVHGMGPFGKSVWRDLHWGCKVFWGLVEDFIGFGAKGIHFSLRCYSFLFSSFRAIEPPSHCKMEVEYWWWCGWWLKVGVTRRKMKVDKCIEKDGTKVSSTVCSLLPSAVDSVMILCFTDGVWKEDSLLVRNVV